MIDTQIRLWWVGKNLLERVASHRRRPKGGPNSVVTSCDRRCFYLPTYMHCHYTIGIMCETAARGEASPIAQYPRWTSCTSNCLEIHFARKLCNFCTRRQAPPPRSTPSRNFQASLLFSTSYCLMRMQETGIHIECACSCMSTLCSHNWCISKKEGSRKGPFSTCETPPCSSFTSLLRHTPQAQPSPPFEGRQVQVE